MLHRWSLSLVLLLCRNKDYRKDFEQEKQNKHIKINTGKREIEIKRSEKRNAIIKTIEIEDENNEGEKP